MLPKEWLGDDESDLLKVAAKEELSGGYIANIIRKCAIYMLSFGQKKLTKETFLRIIEEYKR